LEEELGIRQGALQQAIAIYNEDCENGEDTQFHKASEWLEALEPPLVALDITPGRGAVVPFFTLGGLDTLPTGEVVDVRRQVIAGLFAAGRTACGVVRRADGYNSGMSVGDATFSGRMAGKQVAEEDRH
jgi:predicted oxidoreductase